MQSRVQNLAEKRFQISIARVTHKIESQYKPDTNRQEINRMKEIRKPILCLMSSLFRQLSKVFALVFAYTF